VWQFCYNKKYMIQIKNLSVRNFMSVGNATQGVDFDRRDLTLVLGENLDLGGDGSRNGTGKTTIINALSYALYGTALSNIRKDNLVNKTNGKNMMVSLDFSVAGQDYRIERGRKPNVLKFYVNNHEQEILDDAQGDSRETQGTIERTLGLSHDMFKHILALNTYTEPFLSLKANEQRTIIEQLLGITMLSERADKIKELNKSTKDAISQEEFRIRAVQEANKRIEEQIESLKQRQRMWDNKFYEDLSKLQSALDELSKIDINAELAAHKSLIEYNTLVKERADIQKTLTRARLDQAREMKSADKLLAEVNSLADHKCHSCGQDLHDVNHEAIIAAKKTELDTACTEVDLLAVGITELENELEDLGEPGPQPSVFYDKESDAVEHNSSINNLRQQITAKMDEHNPYSDQIVDMQQKALQEVSYDYMNELSRLQEHQEFLLKLLTSKDSFIRKKIIEQNLSYLNSRLTHYLDRIGLPHTVVFQNDLTVSIEELGRELDFDNLSRGERNRLILSMSWAFRDVFESLYQPINLLFIDEMIDNGLDTQGVESALALLKQMSRERHKSIWLVSHRDELAGRVENILKVVKESGFTSYNTDVDIA
jgi:DNA repair exonuclease SbcCD ATPase subunit